MKDESEFSTKEEYNKYLKYYYAGLAMQGLLLSGSFDVSSDINDSVLSYRSVIIAKNLIEKLEKN